MMHVYGERVKVTHNGREVRGWLERADDYAVVVRLPSKENPEVAGDELATLDCPPPTRFVTIVTCTSVYDHRGIMIGYLDPTWARTEETALEFSRFMSSLGWDEGRIEQHAKQMLRVRRLSLAVPLQTASIWNDHGRISMQDQARRELEAEAMTADYPGRGSM